VWQVHSVVRLCFKNCRYGLKHQTYTIEVNESTIGKVYPYLLPFTYSAFFEGKIQIVNRGIFKAPLLIEMIGAVDEPEVIIRKGTRITQRC
jgi:hypothetical protein